ncbi:MAG: hypothetical protein ACI4XO_01540 [Akkermansia sp.]
MAKLKTGSQAKRPTMGASVSAGALTRAGAAGKSARPARGAGAKSPAGAASPMWMRKATMVGKAMNGGAKMSRNTGNRNAAAAVATEDEPLTAPMEEQEEWMPEDFLPEEVVAEPTKTESLAAAPVQPLPAEAPLPELPAEPTKTEPLAAASVQPSKTEPTASKAITSPLRKLKTGDSVPLQSATVTHSESSGLSLFTLVIIVLLGFYLGLLMHHRQKVGEFSWFPGIPHLPG